MKRMITNEMRDSFNVIGPKFEFAFGLCDKGHVDVFLTASKKKQRILILRRTIK